MGYTQAVLTLFLLFALSRVYLRFRSAEISLGGLLFWSMIFGFAIIAVLFPNLTGIFADILHVGRGVDAVVYISVVLLFYLVFRLYVYQQDIKREISELVRQHALKEWEEKHEKTSKN